MNEDLMSLDELFAEARQVLRQEKPPRAAEQDSRIGNNYAALPSALFANEANWHPLRIVALMHKETETFLGNFQELEHNTETGCRKLRRLTQPEAQHVAVLYVSGPGYLEFRKPESNTYAPDVTALECDELLLDSPPVSAHVVKIYVHRSNGGITRVKLDHETVFYSVDVMLTLAGGTDILPALSLQSKKLIKGML